jgi:hypothetical protein
VYPWPEACRPAQRREGTYRTGAIQLFGYALPRIPLPRRWVNRLFLDTPVNELLLGSALGTLVVLHFRREPPYDQQQLREQGAQKYQEESHAHSSAVVGLMHL